MVPARSSGRGQTIGAMMTERFRLLAPWLAGTATVLLLAQAASATPKDDAAVAAAQSDLATDIVVAGQRRAYAGDAPPLEIPQSIQVLDGELLRAAGVTRLDDALDLAGGVARQNNFGGLFDNFACRGFAGDENSASNYLVNGFNAARGYGGARDTVNVERIEVLKGPNSALFGRVEPGCTINIVTKKPQRDVAAAATLSRGSFGSWRSEGDLNIPLASTLALRVTGAAERADSFRDTIASRRATVTPTILWTPARDTGLSYELEYIRQDLDFDRGVVAVNGRLDAIPRTRFLGEPGDGPLRIEALGHQAQIQHAFSRNWSMILGAGYRETEAEGFSTEAELVASRQQLFVDGRTLSRQRRYRDYRTTDLTFRAELGGRFATFGARHHVLIGADWDDYGITVIQNRYRPPPIAAQRTTAIGNSVDIFAPVYGKLPAVAPFQNNVERQFSYGFYVQDQIDVTARLKLRVGGRYDDFEQDVRNRLLNSRTGQHRTAFNPQVGASVLLTDAVSLYGNYARGFRPNIGVTFDAQPFTPERTTSYEAGVKLALFNERVTGTLAAFRTTKSNVLTADPVNAGFSQAIGRARSRGVEAELSGRLPYDARIQLNYAYTNAEVARDAADPNFGLALRVGDPLLNIPRHSAGALLFKDLALGGSKLTLGAGVNYVGRRLGETGYRFPDGGFFYLPAYTLTRVLASWEPVARVRISGEVTNLFDTHYYPSSYSRLWVTPGTPRRAMVRIGYRY